MTKDIAARHFDQVHADKMVNQALIDEYLLCNVIGDNFGRNDFLIKTKDIMPIGRALEDFLVEG